MKTIGRFSHLAAPLALAVSTLLLSGNLRASGPGGGSTAGGNGTVGGVGSGTAGGASTGAAVSGGSHGGGTFAAAAPAGARSGVLFSNSTARMSSGVSAQSASSRPVGTSPYYESRSAAPTLNGTRFVSRYAARPSNGWTESTVDAANSSAARSSRILYSSNGFTNNRFTGPTASTGTYNNWSSAGRFSRGRYPYRYSYYPYALGPAYAPYIGYYGGGYDGAYPYYADGNNADTSVASNNSTVTPQYSDQGQEANNGPQNPAPPQPGAQNPNGNAAQGTVPNNGPDSLVEAVQQELIRRGYFAGKVDAMYGPDTKDALRKFQQDHHLADTGLINEATLHALQLD